MLSSTTGCATWDKTNLFLYNLTHGDEQIQTIKPDPQGGGTNKDDVQ